MGSKVSIVIPVYCAENTLKKCVESLIYGTYSNIEIILIEDCSSDKSWQVCLKLQEHYSCVKAYQNPKNSGPSAARNHGLQLMSGKYLMFVDSDDWVEPDYVSTFVEIYEKFQPDLIISGYVNHDEVQNATADYFGWKNTDTVVLKSLKNELLPLYHSRLLQQIWNKFFLADVVRENHLMFDTGIQMGEDFRFLLSYLEYISGDRLVEINKPLYHYIRCSGNSLMSQFGKEKLDEPLKNLERLYTLLGMSENEKSQQLEKDRETQINLWAYLIMHNMGMRHKEKKQMILNLDARGGQRLYRENWILYYKERVMLLFKRLAFWKHGKEAGDFHEQ